MSTERLCVVKLFRSEIYGLITVITKQVLDQPWIEILLFLSG